MMKQEPFYFGIIRKYYVLFGNLFTDIKVLRFATDGSTRELVRVPIALGSRDKTLARILAEPGVEPRGDAIVLPRMSFEMTGPRYDANRHQSSAEQIRIASDNTYARLYAPVPWDFDFNLYVYAKNQEDGLKIIEQILPFFTPDITLRAELIADTVTMNVPIVLNSVASRDDYAEGEIADKRAIIWTLSFTLKGWMFGPQYTGGVIKFVDVPLRTPPDGVAIADAYANNSGILEEITVRGGLLANGSPTTNAAASVPYDQIEIDDDWAFITTIVSYDSGEGSGGADEPVV